MFPSETKILVVDDMKSMRMVVKKALVILGLSNVIEADDGSNAWVLIQEAQNAGVPFQLVISDLNMPQVQGIELLRQMRANDKTRRTPFVMITAESEKSQIIEAAKAGANSYIVKPFTADTVKEKLEAVYSKISER
jgi:two-component system chemotaxis response regulator CheY